MGRRRIILSVLFLLVFGGCTIRLTDFTVIGTKNFKVPENVQIGERVRGEDCAPIILVFPLGTPNLKEAIDRAIEKGGGDVLIDAVIYSEFSSFVIFIQQCFVVEGTVGKTW